MKDFIIRTNCRQKRTEKKTTRGRVQTRATTAKAKNNKNVKFLTESNKNLIRRSLFGSTEDISSQTTQSSANAIASSSTHQAVDMTPPEQNLQRVCSTGKNYQYELRRSTMLNSSNTDTVS